MLIWMGLPAAIPERIFTLLGMTDWLFISIPSKPINAHKREMHDAEKTNLSFRSSTLASLAHQQMWELQKRKTMLKESEWRFHLSYIYTRSHAFFWGCISPPFAKIFYIPHDKSEQEVTGDFS